MFNSIKTLAAVTWLMATLVLSGCTTLSSEKPWLRLELKEEFTAKKVNTPGTDTYQWNDYLVQEEKLFNELREQLAASDTTDGYRYAADSALNPLLQTPNWNRTFVLKPQKIRAAIVMLHGLTDSPYSVRNLAQTFEQHGFLVIALRVPGHGTVPSGLLNITWKDWAAATRLAVKEAQRELGDNPNLYLLGYSNGGTLALNYTLDALEDKNLPQPKKLILLSPMIGISKLAGFSKSLELISHVPLQSSRRWLSKSPEYNPFKYNSFPVNAAWQAHRFSRQLQRKIKRLENNNTLQQLPPVLTFQSVMDATVKTAAIENYFYRYLPQNNSELVLFDLNRHQSFSPITTPKATNFMRAVFSPGPHPYNLVTIGNRNPTTMAVSERYQAAGTQIVQERPLELAFPENVFSLSHVALPFPIQDPLYGLEPSAEEFYGIRLGNRHLLGESNTLIIKASTGMRLYSNPFYPYLQERIFSWIDVPQ